MAEQPDFNQIMQQAQKVQSTIQKAQREIAQTTVKGEAGAGLVVIEMNGRHEALSVHLDASLMSEDKEIIEELVAAAINDAVHKIEGLSRDKMTGMLSGLGLPKDFTLPGTEETKE